MKSSGSLPWWINAVYAGVFGGLGALLMQLSVGLGEPWRVLVLVIGWLLVGLGVWCLYFYGFMAVIEFVTRQPSFTWIVAPAAFLAILAPSVVLAYFAFR